METFLGKNNNPQQYSFDNVKHRLGRRLTGFQYIMDYLSATPSPAIVETGCARQMDNFEGDGQSSSLFDNAIQNGGSFMTVDISKASVEYCTTRVSSKSCVVLADSITFLRSYGKYNKTPIDLLYLDSFDAHPDVVEQSALHHLYEFIVIQESLKDGCLVVVDDNWKVNGEWVGKGKYINDFMSKIGINPIFVGYQIMWKFHK